MTDQLLHRLAALPMAEPDAQRGERIRARCHARLSRSQRPKRRRSGPTGGVRLWQPLVVALGGLYLTEVIRQALRFYGMI